jgi:type I restriction enzyme, S subunit
MKRGWPEIELGKLCVFEKGCSPTLKTEAGQYPLVVTASYRRSSREYQFDKPAVCIPLISSTGHGNAAIHRIHYQEGKFALADLLVAAIPRNNSKLDAKFLWRYLSAAKDKKLVPLMQGTANVSLKEQDLWTVTVPLPPIGEQQQVVAHLDAIEARLTRAQRLREESAVESRVLIRSLIDTQHCAGVRPVPMNELVTWRSPDVVVSQSESYTFAGVYSFGRGVFRKEAVSGMDFAYDRLTRLTAGEFTYPKLMAWEGALGVVPPDCDGCHVSPEFPVFTVDESKVLPDILDIHFKTPTVWKDLAAISTGTNLRRRRLNPSSFLSYQFPLPPMEVQQHVKAIADRAATKRKLQKDAALLEKVLLPSLLDRIFNP